MLHRVVREHLATFAAEIEARGDDQALPAFVRRELERFVTCGALARTASPASDAPPAAPSAPALEPTTRREHGQRRR